MKLSAMGIDVADGEFSRAGRFVLRAVGQVQVLIAQPQLANEGGPTARALVADSPSDHRGDAAQGYGSLDGKLAFIRAGDSK